MKLPSFATPSPQKMQRSDQRLFHIAQDVSKSLTPLSRDGRTAADGSDTEWVLWHQHIYIYIHHTISCIHYTLLCIHYFVVHIFTSYYIYGKFSIHSVTYRPCILYTVYHIYSIFQIYIFLFIYLYNIWTITSYYTIIHQVC